MALSTGFDEAKVYAALTGRIGWRNPTLEGYDIVDTANAASLSGRYFNDGSFHPSCTIQNLKETQEDADIDDTEFNTFLTNLYRSICAGCVTSVFNNTEAIESGLIYKRSSVPASSTPQLVTNSGKFVGIRVNVANGDYAVMIDSITVLLDGAKTFNLYIYKDFKTDPLVTKEITTTAYEETTVSVGEVLNYLSSTNKGGVYYIGYYQDDLGDAKAVDCSPICNEFKIVGFTSIEATTDATFGFNRYQYAANYSTYGLNIELSSYHDYTERVVNAAKAGLFDEYIGLAMATKVVEHAMNAQRLNGQAIQASAQLSQLYDQLNNEPDNAPGMPVSPGLKSRLKREVKKLQDAFKQHQKPISVSIC